MHDPLTFDARLADAYERFLATAPISIDAREMASSAVAAGRQARGFDVTFLGVGVSLDRRWAAILVAVLVLASLLAIGVGGWLVRSTQPPLSDPLATPSMEAIFVRTGSSSDVLEVVAVRPDGTERVVRQLRSATYLQDRTFALGAHLSEDGWIALATESFPGAWSNGGDADAFYALLDLGDLGRQPIHVAAYAGRSSTWSANGIFASQTKQFCCIQLINPRTGVTDELLINCCGGGPSTIIAADGSGVLGYVEGNGARTRYKLLLPSNPPSVAEVPAMAFREPRFVAPGGTSLNVCGPESGFAGGCADVGAWVFDGTNEPIDWTEGDVSGLQDGGFTADGRGLWLLYVRSAGSAMEAVIAKSTAPGASTVVWRETLPAEVDHVDLGAFALDDSIVLLSLSHNTQATSVDHGKLLVSLLDGRASVPNGVFAGYVKGDLVASWR